MKIEACVFDFGGVMTTSIMPERVRPLVASLGLEWKIIDEGFAKYRRLMDGDFITIDEMYSKIWQDAGIDVPAEVTAKIVEEDQASFLYPNLETLAFMRSLKERGFAIGILTNMCSSFAALFRKHFADFISLSDATVISGEVHLYKPMREIYDLLRGKLGTETGRICFFDDVEANCQGARDAGWQAIRFSDAKQAEADLLKLTGEPGAGV